MPEGRRKTREVVFKVQVIQIDYFGPRQRVPGKQRSSDGSDFGGNNTVLREKFPLTFCGSFVAQIQACHRML